MLYSSAERKPKAKDDIRQEKRNCKGNYLT